ncbi:MAG: cupin domain-containing protein [Pelagibacteraceae bacterium]|jgi:dTDP-4-dehydrorhamnose 3,5-epimerase-like enzyme|nr:cupin domain-containing protein [Pelagibacteraceae bacterium]HJO14176.1 cupin domain-containing protein [Alphaproteobacteria bacterium]|tara:strand:- start:4612 stop:5007 length:396 start_codon:yes stop_codon:yes gene_type:complete
MKNQKLPKNVKVKLSDFFEDKRGKILNIANILFRSCALIKSKKNSIRANHYHKKDWHYCYVLKGKIAYYHRKHGTKSKPKKIIINKGELFFTPPMIDHAMKFLSYTEFLTLGRGSRSKINYDEDTKKIDLI